MQPTFPLMSTQQINRRDFVKIVSALYAGMCSSFLIACDKQAKASEALDADDQTWQKVDELLRQMTLEEKTMQVSCVVPLALLDSNGLMRGQADKLLRQGIGHIAGLGMLGNKSPDAIAKSVNTIQRYLVNETRLKIPAIFHNEALNGVVAPKFSAFPTPISLAASWDPAAVEAMAEVMRRQMRSVGLLHALAPVMDVARDARWGRVTETYGEDPYLVSALSVAFTRGIQGKDLSQGVLACAKHFLGYAVTESGQNMAATAIGPRELYDVYARPFEASIRLRIALASSSIPFFTISHRGLSGIKRIRRRTIIAGNA